MIPVIGVITLVVTKKEVTVVGGVESGRGSSKKPLNLSVSNRCSLKIFSIELIRKLVG